MKGLLLDENLPYRLRFPVASPIIHSTDLGNSVSDSDLWNYSKENGLVIVTKDADFSDRIAVAEPPPWVIHVRFGNIRAKVFHEFFGKHWATIVAGAQTHQRLLRQDRGTILAIQAVRIGRMTERFLVRTVSPWHLSRHAF